MASGRAAARPFGRSCLHLRRPTVGCVGSALALAMALAAAAEPTDAGLPLEAATPSQVEAGAPPLTIVGATFFAVRVRDDEAAGRWYRETFALEEVAHMEAEDGRFSIRLLRRPGLVVELIRSRDANEAPARSLGHFKAGLWVKSIDAYFAWLRARAADTDNRLVTDDNLDARTFVLRDPEGNRIQLFESLGQ